MTRAIPTTRKGPLLAAAMALSAVSLLAMLLLAGPTFAAEAAEPAEPLAVVLTSGRAFAGAVDARTSAAALVLRMRSGGATIRRTIAWNRIAFARVGERELPVADLPAEAGRLATAFVPAPIAPAPIGLAQSATDGNRAAAEIPQAAASRVTSLAFDAALGNWDADVEADGLLIQLSALDAWGREVATNGTLQVELYAPVRRSFDLVPQGNGSTTDLLGRWTVPVRAEMFARGSAVFRLPFQALHPEFNTAIYWYGLVNVRLAVPGSDVLERSQDGISLRPFAPVRDALQINTGRRFLPGERTGRGKNDPAFHP